MQKCENGLSSYTRMFGGFIETFRSDISDQTGLFIFTELDLSERVLEQTRIRFEIHDSFKTLTVIWVSWNHRID